jgi:hypothetical protein
MSGAMKLSIYLVLYCIVLRASWKYNVWGHEAEHIFGFVLYCIVLRASWKYNVRGHEAERIFGLVPMVRMRETIQLVPIRLRGVVIFYGFFNDAVNDLNNTASNGRTMS